MKFEFVKGLSEAIVEMILYVTKCWTILTDKLPCGVKTKYCQFFAQVHSTAINRFIYPIHESYFIENATVLMMAFKMKVSIQF